MVTFPIRSRLTLPVAPLAAVAAALVAVVAVLGAPQDVFESLVMTSGLPALFPAAEPPLGLTARLALMVTLGGAGASLAWFAVYCLFGARSIVLRRPGGMGAPRAPLHAARELGVPFLDVKAVPRAPVVRELPRNLDTPLSAFDPDAIPDEPSVPVPLVAALARSDLAPGERIDSFELPVPIAAPRTDATIKGLLERLERGVADRPHPAPEVESFIAQAATLQSTLGELRRAAMR